jgi:hypothetical protein
VLATAATMLEFFDSNLKPGELAAPDILRASTAAAAIDPAASLAE